MAELALGGIEVAIRPRTRPAECAHETCLTITAAGVERSICETCGHISVRFLSELSGPVTREHFARPADECLEPDQLLDHVNETPFATEERLGLRRRDHHDRERLFLTA